MTNLAGNSPAIENRALRESLIMIGRKRMDINGKKTLMPRKEHLPKGS